MGRLLRKGVVQTESLRGSGSFLEAPRRQWGTEAVSLVSRLLQTSIVQTESLRESKKHWGNPEIKASKVARGVVAMLYL